MKIYTKILKIHIFQQKEEEEDAPKHQKHFYERNKKIINKFFNEQCTFCCNMKKKQAAKD
jgi:hypothetical protein